MVPSVEVKRERVREEGGRGQRSGSSGSPAPRLRRGRAHPRRPLGVAEPVSAVAVRRAVVQALVAELYELSQRVSEEQEYWHKCITGRACFLAGMSSQASAPAPRCGSLGPCERPSFR